MPHRCGAAAWKWPNSTPCHGREQVSRRVSTRQARVPAPQRRKMGPNSKTVALIGSETLLAREVRDIVATGGADFGLRLVAAVEEESGALTRVGDEASIVNGLNAESLADTRAVILAGN